MLKTIIYMLGKRPVLILLLIVNLLGTIYGFYWYRFQLQETPAKFILFVPDSPTASLFFCIVLFAFLFKKNVPLVEALAVVTLFKYGIWATFMNLFVGFEVGKLTLVNYMLMFSHLGMAIEGLLYAPYYRFRMSHLMIAAVWTIHNEMIDYIFGMMPQYSILTQYMPQIGYVTFWLSIISIWLAYFVGMRKNRLQASFR